MRLQGNDNSQADSNGQLSRNNTWAGAGYDDGGNLASGVDVVPIPVSLRPVAPPPLKSCGNIAGLEAACDTQSAEHLLAPGTRRSHVRSRTSRLRLGTEFSVDCAVLSTHTTECAFQSQVGEEGSVCPCCVNPRIRKILSQL